MVVVIFPEGTRMARGATRRYGISGAALARETGGRVFIVHMTTQEAAALLGHARAEGEGVAALPGQLHHLVPGAQARHQQAGGRGGILQQLRELLKLFDQLLFFFLPFSLSGLIAILQIIGKHCPVGRIGSGEKICALRPLAITLPVPPAITRGKKSGLFF